MTLRRDFNKPIKLERWNIEFQAADFKMCLEHQEAQIQQITDSWEHHSKMTGKKKKKEEEIFQKAWERKTHYNASKESQ